MFLDRQDGYQLKQWIVHTALKHMLWNRSHGVNYLMKIKNGKLMSMFKKIFQKNLFLTVISQRKMLKTSNNWLQLWPFWLVTCFLCFYFYALGLVLACSKVFNSCCCLKWYRSIGIKNMEKNVNHSFCLRGFFFFPIVVSRTSL